jgi:NAD(P)-dependent dehydrogenase (short-subunit alcohol dehydrogenase family)
MSETKVPGLLDGKRAIVTGGARGIGYGVAELMHAAGAELMIADVDEAGARRACEEIGGDSGRLRWCAVDIREVAQIDAMVAATVEAFGGLDILVNNASHARFGLVLDLTEEDWDYSYEVGLRGNFFCMQRAARAMAEAGGGKIVNVSSMTVPLGHARNCAYSSMKGGIEVMTRVAAVELSPHGIQVNAVAPGPVDTPLARSVQTEWGWKQRVNHLPGGSFAEPSDIAGAVAFLCSGLSDWITGAILPVDGGYTATGALVEPAAVAESA